MTQPLSPSQQQAFDGLIRGLSVGNVLLLWGGTGMGKTTVLRELHQTAGGAFLNMKDYLDALRDRHPLAVEETFEQLVREALSAHDTVILDDLNLLTDVVAGCNEAYPRNGFLNAPLELVTAYAAAAGKKLVIGSDDGGPYLLQQRGYSWGIEELSVEDYAFLCAASLPRTAAARLDYGKIHRFAPHLNAHQLKGACVWLQDDEELDTDGFIEYLRSQQLTSNVDLGEVEQVDLRDLKGIDDIIESLETHVVLPLENDELARALDLQPRRGVLLAGPPGTGKTTIGRALAHRLKSKFFLVDGTFISGTSGFYRAISRVFEAAKENAPSILFIDDSDVIFESGEEHGLYRYLLTMLDGLESETVGEVCVMMTAMDVGNIPPALLRSGRIELWLETRLPSSEARAAILRDHLDGAVAALGEVDLRRLVEATDGFTGADLKSLVSTGKNLFAYHQAQGREPLPPTDHFLGAIEMVRANKERYARAEAEARRRRTSRRAGQSRR
jgi:ATP-dependent 26S proteasome regulatory subunit